MRLRARPRILLELAGMMEAALWHGVRVNSSGNAEDGGVQG